MAKIILVRGGPRRVRPKKYANHASAVAYSLSASPASYTFTAIAAAVAAQRNLAGAPASFTDTASAAAVAARRNLAGAPASYTFTAIAATPQAALKFTAAPASFVDTASSASVAAQRKLAAAAASFTDTASSATLKLTWHLGASPGSFTDTASSANLVYQAGGAQAYTLSASPATFSFTAAPAVLSGPQILFDTHDWVEPWSHKRRRKKREEEERLEAQRLTDRKPIVTGTATPALKVALKDKPKPIEQEWKPDPRPLQLDISAFLTKMQAVDRLDEQERRRMIEEDDLRMIAAFLQHLDA